MAVWQGAHGCCSRSRPGVLRLCHRNDILGKRLYRHELARGQTSWVETPHRLCAFAFLERPGHILAAFDKSAASPALSVLPDRAPPELNL